MKGPIPKPPSQRVGHHSSRASRTLEDRGTFTVPALPAESDPRTRAWWEAVKASPMAGEFCASDWQALLAVAAVYESFWKTGRAGYHSEFRLAAREFGLTSMSRRALQWEIRRLGETTPPAPSAPRRPSRSTLAVLTGGKPE